MYACVDDHILVVIVEHFLCMLICLMPVKCMCAIIYRLGEGEWNCHLKIHIKCFKGLYCILLHL